MITSQSLDRSNLVFNFSPENFSVPENQDLISLFEGEKNRGANFVDNPAMRLKVLHIPGTNLSLTLEGNRFRIDDHSQSLPAESILISEGVTAYRKLFSRCKLDGFGFNFDIYFRFDRTIPVDFFFKTIVKERVLENSDLRNFGIQFALERPSLRRIDTYFLKITAPIEIVVHANYHFNNNELPKPERLQKLFEKSYDEIGNFVSNLNF